MRDKAPTCQGCGRSPSDRIRVDGTAWEPDFREVRPGVWRCFVCRGEPHPDMPDGYLPDTFLKQRSRDG